MNFAEQKGSTLKSNRRISYVERAVKRLSGAKIPRNRVTIDMNDMLGVVQRCDERKD